MGIGAREIMILLVIALLLFGASRLPTLARSLGRSARILKAEAKGLGDDDRPDEEPPARNTDQGREQQPPQAPQQYQQYQQQPGQDRPRGQEYGPGYGQPEAYEYEEPRDQAGHGGAHAQRPVPRASLEGPAARPEEREESPRERPATDL